MFSFRGLSYRTMCNNMPANSVNESHSNQAIREGTLFRVAFILKLDKHFEFTVRCSDSVALLLFGLQQWGKFSGASKKHAPFNQLCIN